MGFRPRKEKKRKPITFNLTEDDIEYLKEWAKREDMPLAQIGSQGIEFLIREEKQKQLKRGKL